LKIQEKIYFNISFAALNHERVLKSIISLLLLNWVINFTFRCMYL